MRTPITRETTKQVVKRTLDRLRELNLQAQNGDPQRRHRYNRAILAKARKFAASEQRRRLMQELGGDPDLADILGFIEVLMRVSSRDDRRLRSRHGQAIKFAALKGTRPRRLRKFLARKGGLKGCARRYRELGSGD
jgi:hypothetical protein